jgi:hypothetical protein
MSRPSPRSESTVNHPRCKPKKKPTSSRRAAPAARHGGHVIAAGHGWFGARTSAASPRAAGIPQRRQHLAGSSTDIRRPARPRPHLVLRGVAPRPAEVVHERRGFPVELVQLGAEINTDISHEALAVGESTGSVKHRP